MSSSIKRIDEFTASDLDPYARKEAHREYMRAIEEGETAEVAVDAALVRYAEARVRSILGNRRPIERRKPIVMMFAGEEALEQA